jgi:hypothetical protein
MSNQILTTNGSPDAPLAAFSGRRRFPLRTLMICFTAWLIATEVLVFDEVKVYTNAAMLEQAARVLRGPQVVIPSERPNAAGTIRMQNL